MSSLPARLKKTEMIPRHLAVLLILCSILPSSTAAPEKADSHCLAGVTVNDNDRLGYRLRGDRCEGRYSFRPFSGSLLRVVGLQRIVRDDVSERVNPLALDWHGPLQEEVWIRAVSLRSGVYYRMDSKRPADKYSYVWPTSLLTSLNLRPSHLGIVATYRMPINGKDRDVLLPVTVRNPLSSKTAGVYLLRVLPGIELEELYLSLWRLTEDSQQVIVKARALEYGYYPADRPIDIPLPDLSGEGLFRVDLGGETRTGRPAATKTWIYQCGNEPKSTDPRR
ncbi:MAG: hypothetical protein GY835_18590 [bacterium]|nr:hypothetical protein [bacterium]